MNKKNFYKIEYTAGICGDIVEFCSTKNELIKNYTRLLAPIDRDFEAISNLRAYKNGEDITEAINKLYTKSK